MQQGSDEWLKARAGKFTASRFADLMAVTKSGPSASRQNLITTLALERITGEPVLTYANEAMQRGTELEPVARAAYEALTGEWVDLVGFVQDDRWPYVGVSPDGLIGDDGLIEIKCPFSQAKHLEALRRGAHAVEYRWQVQGQMWITGRQWCDVVSFDPRFPDGLQLAITRVQRDDEAIAKLAKACEDAEQEVQSVVEQLTKLRDERE